MSDAGTMIHPMAWVDDDVVLGEGTVVRQFASLTRGVRMGARGSVSPHAMLDGSVYGDDVIVSGGVMAGRGFLVGSRVFLGPGVVLCNDAWPEVSKEGWRPDGGPSVIVADDASIGAGAILLPGVRVGVGAVVGAGEVVRTHVPDSTIFLKGRIRSLPDLRYRRATRVRAAPER